MSWNNWQWPVWALAFLTVFASILWPWQAKSTKDKGNDTEHHSERAYKSFEFFVTVSLAIVAGLGYIRLAKFTPTAAPVAREGMVGLGALALVVATVLTLFIIIHQGSKLRRWRDIEWKKLPFWLELWMCISIMAVGSAIWIFSHVW